MFGLPSITTYLIAGGVVLATLTGTYIKGHSDGSASVTHKYEVQQAEAVKTALDKQSRALSDEYQAQLAQAETDKKNAVALAEKKVKTKTLIQTSVVLKNPVCVLPVEEKSKLNEIIKAPNDL